MPRAPEAPPRALGTAVRQRACPAVPRESVRRVCSRGNTSAHRGRGLELRGRRAEGELEGRCLQLRAARGPSRAPAAAFPPEGHWGGRHLQLSGLRCCAANSTDAVSAAEASACELLEDRGQRGKSGHSMW